ncbi:ABC transporter substrate-binding protein [Actinacidiphila sp. bgisy145]|uniref:ABC transporter substrate-binding protein n=1 Tax=Actinacidiphila sp. bgisy145 TaxID=3413792 RepID=UPI003EBC968D
MRPQLRGRRAAAALAAAGALLLTACGGGSSAGSGGSSGATVTIGVSGNILDTPIEVADGQGYFAAQGLKVEYVTLNASTGASALQSGSVQFLNDSPNGFLAALGKNVPETAIGTDAGGYPLGLIVSTKFAKAHHLTASTPAAQVAKALDGSTGGSSSANTKGEASIFLKGYGVDPGKVKWVSLPSPVADKAALKSNQIDWFATSEPTPLEIQDSGDGVVVADPVKVPAWSQKEAGYGQFVVARSNYLSQHADTARKVAAAVQQATAYMHAHLESAAVQAAARKAVPGVAADVVAASLRQVAWPTSDAMDAQGWATTLGFVNSLVTLDKKAAVTDSQWTNKYLP